ncbi:MAG: hypothetical protein LBE36_13610, partial [Flavobacteriaceae bacterium]|nr:hypothetical protein [Flavobacteriaceae bacterium]
MNNLQELYKEYSAIYPDVPEDMFYLSLQDEGGNIIEKSLNSVINEIYDVKKKDRTTPTGSIVPEQILEQFRGVPQNQIDTRYQQPTTQPTQPPLFSPPLEGSGEEIFPQDFSVPMGSETDLALLDSESLSTPQTANSQQSRLKDETISQTPFTASESTNTEFSGTENLPSSSIPNSSVELEATPPITDDITAEDLKLMASIPAQQNPLKDTTVIFQDGEPMAVFQRLPAQERSIQTLAGKSDIQDGMFSDINPLGINIGSNVLAGQDPRADAMLDYIKQQEETERKNYGNYWHGLIPDIDDIPEIKPRDFNKTTIFNADKIRDVSAGSIENPISVNEGNEKLITDEKNGIRERVKYNEFNNKWGADTINIDGYAASVSGRFLYRIKDDNLLKNTQNEENIFAENYNERVRNANEKNREANTINSKINDDNILYRGAGLLKDPPKSEADQYISDLQSKYEIILTEEQKNSLYTQQGRDTLEISLEFAKRKKENPNIDDNTLYNQIIKERQSEILSPEEKQRIGKQYISDLFDDGRMLQAINNGYADALKLTQDDVKEYQFYNQYFSSPQNVQDFGDFMNDEGRYLFDTSAVKNFFSGSSQRARRNVFNAFLDWRSKQERLDLEFSKRGFEQAEYRISNSGENTAQLENANADREKYLDAFASAIIEKQNKEKDYAYLESAFVTTAKEDSEREDLLLRARNGDSAAKTKIFLGNLALGVGTSLQDGLTGIGRIVVSPFGSDNANDLLDEFSNPLTIGNVQIAGISNEVNKYRYNGNSYEEIDGVLFQVGANGKRFKPQEAPPTYDMELISSERSLNYTGIAFITSKMATDILVTNKVGGRTNTVFGNTARTLRNTKLATRVFGETSQITKNLTALQKAQRAGFTGWYVQMYNGNYQAAKEGGITSELGRHLYAGFNSYLTALLSKINPDVNFLKTVNSESRAIVAHLMNNRLDAGLVGARSLLNKIISTSGSELGEEFAQQLTQDLTNFFTNIYGNKNLQISTVGDYKDTFYATIIPSAIIALFGGRMNPRNVTIGDKTIDIRNYSQSELMTELSRTDGGIQILEAYRDNATSEREKETLDELVKEANTRKKLIDKIPDVQNKTTKALTDIQPLMQKIAKLDADIRNDDGTFEARLKAERDGVIKQINDILDAGDATYGETQSTGGTSQQSQTGNEQPQPQTEEVYTTETPQPETQPSPQSQTSQENQNIWQRAKEKISNLFDFALNNRSEYDWENIGNVTQERAEKINDATGLQITEDYQHVIESNFINHVLKEHGNEKIENQRGQTAITKNDFEKIPEILDAFDNVEHVGKNSYGLDVIRYSKEFEDGTTYYLEEVRNGRNKLAAATMYKKRKPSDNLMNQSSSAATSETNPDAPSFEIGQPLTRSDAENSTSNLTSETLRNPLSENRSANMPTAETVPNRLTSETTSTANIQNIPEIQRIGDKIINGDTNWTPEDEQFRLNNSQEIEQYLNEQQNNSQQNENTQTQQTQPQTETASGTATPPLQPQRATDETTENQATQNIRQNDETNVEETQPENQETLTEDDIDFDTLLQGLIDAENQTLEENVISTREEKGFVWRRYADGSEDITSPKGTIITPFIYAKPAKNRISRQAQSPRRVSNAQFAWNKAKIFGDKTNAQHKREYAKRMREALNFTASTNERNAALLYFANGGKVSTESIKKELNNNVEQYKWAWFGKNNANSIETVSEKIWGNNPHLDRTVIRDELIDVINSYSSSTDIREEILSLYNQANDPYFGFTEDDAYEMWKAEASPREIALADEIRAEEQMPEDVRFEYYRQQYKNSIHSLSDAEQEQYYREIYETDFGRNERVQPQNEGVQSSASGVVGGTQESGGDSQNVAGTASQTQSEQVRQQSKTSQRPFKSITKKAFDGLINLLKATGLARNVIIDKNAMRKRFGESGFKAYQAVTATAKANAQWNADLDRFKNGELPTNVVLSLGTPQGILRAAGINENEITLKQSVLEAKLEQHNLTTDELKNLASAIQNPILVYEWGTKAKSNVIITDLTRENGEKITVAIKAE